MAANHARELSEEEFQQLSQEERIEYSRRVAEGLGNFSPPDSTAKRLFFIRFGSALGSTTLAMLLMWGLIAWERAKVEGWKGPPKAKKQAGLLGTH